ncbi:hypothetical protein, partial [Escherichia coli]
MVHFISCPTKKPIALNMVIVGCCNNSSTNISSASSPNIYDKIKTNEFLLSNSDIKTISTGLVDIIRHSNFEASEDDNAIEYHYAACLRLYRL